MHLVVSMSANSMEEAWKTRLEISSLLLFERLRGQERNGGAAVESERVFPCRMKNGRMAKERALRSELAGRDRPLETVKV